MNRMAGMTGFAAFLIAVSAQVGQAQAPAQKTIWDGVYTEAQATRGQRAVQQNCGSCHSPSSEWSSSMFMTAWDGRPIRELHGHLRATMPFDSPGRLSPQQYADIVAYMLKLNKAPAGNTELPADDESLSKISVTRQSK
jgi:mono/diheme cytochrome c family protein